ncbi:MAG TPA: hypothetical protein VHL34_23320 [Rhizomicrobium sp.]|jgi:hypothetical protein|nr:hypothetical protein [Rhizomicrobium sp.]
MTYVTQHSTPQHSRIHSVIVGVFSAAVAIGAGFLSIAGFVVA